MNEYTTIELVDETRKRLDNENYDEIERLKKEIKKKERKNYELKRQYKAFKERVIRTRAILDKNKNELQARIDTAIEYIKNYYFYNSLDFDVKELIDILKGSDSNESN